MNFIACVSLHCGKERLVCSQTLCLSSNDIEEEGAIEILSCFEVERSAGQEEVDRDLVLWCNGSQCLAKDLDVYLLMGRKQVSIDLESNVIWK